MIQNVNANLSKNNLFPRNYFHASTILDINSKYLRGEDKTESFGPHGTRHSITNSLKLAK